MKKNILFITGTRADYGKMKPLMKALEKDDQFEVFIFVCGMHLSETFGSTYIEVQKDGYRNIYVAFGLNQTQNASVNLGNTITCLSGYVENIRPDLILVHGDRMDALAGAVVGALHNILVGHIEGGELSGTIDESIRHAISKFAHVHFVCTGEAKNRLIQLGEEESRIFVIGSPDIDIMMSDFLPSLEEAKDKYEIPFDRYGILMYHPVTTEYADIGQKIKTVVDAAIESGKNFITVYPNNDLGSEVIMNEYRRIKGNPHFRLFPSLRFEHFLTFLKNADFILGNSSAGIRESGIYGVPAVDIGTRQNGRYSAARNTNLQHVAEDKKEILDALEKTENFRTSSFIFGDGNSTGKFMTIVKEPGFWEMEIQKHFIDRDM
jgi:UDP-N-acetylglucosamine 2-epimerase (hydrolysing)